MTMTEDETRRRFVALSGRLLDALPLQARGEVERLARIEPCRAGCRGFENLGPEAVSALGAAGRAGTPAERRELSRVLMATLAVDAMARIRARALLPEVVERSVAWMPRLLAFLEGEIADDYWFPGDLFLKDYRFVTALTVPCGAQVIDLNDGVGPKTALLLARKHPLAAASAYAAPWFRPHTEGRYLDEFNDAGWTHCYRLVAGLLRLYPRIRGMVATSWFYDPQLSRVSPRLAYIREFPMAHGALIVAHGTTPFDIHSATATSATRRKLYEAGEFTPVCHSVLWRREDMLAWADADARGGGAP